MVFILSLDFFTYKNKFFLFLCKKKDHALYYFIKINYSYKLHFNKKHFRIKIALN